MLNLIKQRSPHDCAICCMAMLTGMSYEDVLACVGDTFDSEKGLAREQEALKRLGFCHTFEHGEPVGDFTGRHRGILSPEFFRGMAWGRRALLTVPSLNYEGAWHMIYYDGQTIFDPSPGRTYDEWRQLRPEEMVLFREPPRSSIVPGSSVRQSQKPA